MTGAPGGADLPAVVEHQEPWGLLPVVVVAASAGGVDALKVLVRALPPDLPAAVLVALHLPRDGHSLLPEILQRVSGLTVQVAEDGAALRPGHLFVGPPDAHLLVRDGRVLLGRGPRENGHRPGHDAMLRSVALQSGPRAVGVVLTGLLDDGAAGLAAVHRYGGSCLVQDPDEADYASMPASALRAVPTATRLPLAALGQQVVRLVKAPPRPAPATDEGQRALDLVELRSAQHGSPSTADGTPPGTPSPFSCPDCRGVLNHVPDTGLLRFRCRTGHAWTAASLASQQEEQVEQALWVALRVLEERADLNRRLADEARVGDRDWSWGHLAGRADEADRSVALVRRALQHELTTGEALSAPSP